MRVTGITLKTLPCGRLSVGLERVLLAFGEALHVGFFAGLHSDGRAISLGDRLPTNHTDGFLTASLLPHKGTPHSFLTPTVADTLHKRGRVVSDCAHRCSPVQSIAWVIHPLRMARRSGLRGWSEFSVFVGCSRLIKITLASLAGRAKAPVPTQVVGHAGHDGGHQRLHLCAYRLRLRRQQLAQHVLQDAAVGVVEGFLRGVDAH